jgi:hypothetical protein
MGSKNLIAIYISYNELLIVFEALEKAIHQQEKVQQSKDL